MPDPFKGDWAAAGWAVYNLFMGNEDPHGHLDPVRIDPVTGRPVRDAAKGTVGILPQDDPVRGVRELAGGNARD
jgi:hypothetical protein